MGSLRQGERFKEVVFLVYFPQILSGPYRDFFWHWDQNKWSVSVFGGGLLL